MSQKNLFLPIFFSTGNPNSFLKQRFSQHLVIFTIYRTKYFIHSFLYLSTSIFIFSLLNNVVSFQRKAKILILNFFLFIKNLTSVPYGVVNPFLSCKITVMPLKYTSYGRFCFNTHIILFYHDCIPAQRMRKLLCVAYFVGIVTSSVAQY